MSRLMTPQVFHARRARARDGRPSTDPDVPLFLLTGLLSVGSLDAGLSMGSLDTGLSIGTENGLRGSWPALDKGSIGA
jgi:hypothetical protein